MGGDLPFRRRLLFPNIEILAYGAEMRLGQSPHPDLAFLNLLGSPPEMIFRLRLLRLASM